MKYTFVGDIHGKHELVSKALDNEGTIIFVGDFVDSFDRSTNDMEKCLQLVLNAIDKNKAKAIFGNHELSYVYSNHRCSGYSFDTECMVSKYKQQILEKFQTHIWIDNFLITHAGLHPRVMETAGTLSDFYLPDKYHRANWIGKYRGGLDPVGGIFWCDFNAEFKPIPNINQIFGHTSFFQDKNQVGIRHLSGENSENFCIDCLDKCENFLELEI